MFPVFDELPRAARIRALGALAMGLAPQDEIVLTSRVLEYEDAARTAEWCPSLVLRAQPVDPEAAVRHLEAASAAPERCRPVAERVKDEPRDR
ncbi:hypothetical protein ACIGT4_18910 [Streptomyces sioyaensis]|uniref:hypothetical protein n=1 Tax=Streptomyces sioyaensis TaxID=67364 RepID=UPI0037D947D9